MVESDDVVKADRSAGCSGGPRASTARPGGQRSSVSSRLAKRKFVFCIWRRTALPETRSWASTAHWFSGARNSPRQTPRMMDTFVCVKFTICPSHPAISWSSAPATRILARRDRWRWEPLCLERSYRPAQQPLSRASGAWQTAPPRRLVPHFFREISASHNDGRRTNSAPRTAAGKGPTAERRERTLGRPVLLGSLRADRAHELKRRRLQS